MNNLPLETEDQHILIPEERVVEDADPHLLSPDLDPFVGILKESETPLLSPPSNHAFLWVGNPLHSHDNCTLLVEPIHRGEVDPEEEEEVDQEEEEEEEESESNNNNNPYHNYDIDQLLQDTLQKVLQELIR